MTTIRDIAEKAKVSVGTVSRYLNGTMRVKPETADRIDKAVADTNYVRNYSAASIKTKQSNTIALVFPSMQSLIFGEMAEAISQELSQEGFILTTYTTGDEQEKEKWAAEKMREHRVAGAIFITEPIGDKDESHLKSLEKSHIKVLTINRYFKENAFASISADFRQGMDLVVAHLKKTGKKKLGLLCGWPEQNQSKVYVEAFKRACLAEGLPCHPDHIKYMYYKEERIIEKTHALLDKGVDGIITVSDRSAIEALALVEKEGLEDQVEVVGMGNTKYAKMKDMTSLDAMLKKLGRQAARTLLAMIREEPYPAYQEIHPQLVVRGQRKKGIEGKTKIAR